jgi:hypothetical protein
MSSFGSNDIELDVIFSIRQVRSPPPVRFISNIVNQ